MRILPSAVPIQVMDFPREVATTKIPWSGEHVRKFERRPFNASKMRDSGRILHQLKCTSSHLRFQHHQFQNHHGCWFLKLIIGKRHDLHDRSIDRHLDGFKIHTQLAAATNPRRCLQQRARCHHRLDQQCRRDPFHRLSFTTRIRRTIRSFFTLVRVCYLLYLISIKCSDSRRRAQAARTDKGHETRCRAENTSATQN